MVRIGCSVTLLPPRPKFIFVAVDVSPLCSWQGRPPPRSKREWVFVCHHLLAVTIAPGRFPIPAWLFVTKSVLLEFEASTNTIEENENRIASENNFYQLRFSLVAGRALSRQERIAGWRAASR
jgi:hypothetical protein